MNPINTKQLKFPYHPRGELALLTKDERNCHTAWFDVRNGFIRGLMKGANQGEKRI
jgi:hypothetical protein